MSERLLVLIIDDEHDFRAICAHVLDRGRYDTAAADATAGLAAFEERCSNRTSRMNNELN